jgi:hypothetical protein
MKEAVVKRERQPRKNNILILRRTIVLSILFVTHCTHTAVIYYRVKPEVIKKSWNINACIKNIVIL